MVLLLSLVSCRPLSLAQRSPVRHLLRTALRWTSSTRRDSLRARPPKGVAAFVCVTSPSDRAFPFLSAGRGVGYLGLVAAGSSTPSTDWSINEPNSASLTMRQSVTGITQTTPKWALGTTSGRRRHALASAPMALSLRRPPTGDPLLRRATAMKVVLPDGRRARARPTARPGAELAATIGPGLAKAALAIRVDGELRDLSAPVPDGAGSRSSPTAAPDALDLIRHDAAHVMATAVMELYPGTKISIGPADRERLLLRLRVPRGRQGHRRRPRADRGAHARARRGRRALRAHRLSRRGGRASASPTRARTTRSS